jgi:carboxyl-terminal processing protease
MNLTAALLCIGNLATAQSVPDARFEALSPRERAYVASRIYSAIPMYFAHFQGAPEFDLEKSYATFLDRAFEARDRREFSLACMEFMAQLKNGHSGFGDAWLQKTSGQPFGFRADFIGGEWAVTHSERSDLEVGEVLAAVAGQPAEAFFQAHRKYIGASSERAQRTSLFDRPYLFPQAFDVLTRSRRTVSIARIAPVAMSWKPEGRWLKSGVAYLKIPSFADPAFEDEALALLDTYGEATALIIDLRGNRGGDTPARLIDALMDRPYRALVHATPVHVAVWKVLGGFFDTLAKDPRAPKDELYGYLEAMNDVGSQSMLMQPSLPVHPAATRFTGRVFVLIDRLVASSAEDFCVPFKDNRRATFVGEATMGSTGQPYSHSFANGMYFRISARRQFFPDGSPFEGVGVFPDVEIPTSAATLANPRDEVLEKALELARKVKP